jgi:hypothetical protein
MQQAPPAPDPGRRVYEEYVAARRELGESVDALRYDDFLALLERQRQAHRKALQCDDVEYSVRVKDGKATLVARPVRK